MPEEKFKCLVDGEETVCKLVNLAGYEIQNTKTNEKIGDLIRYFEEEDDIEWEKLKEDALKFNNVKVVK